MQNIPSKVYRKTEAAWDIAVLFSLIFWMPMVALGVLLYIMN